MPTISIYLEELTLDTLKRLASEEGRTVSNMVSRLVMQEHYRKNMTAKRDPAGWSSDNPFGVERRVADVK